MPTRQTRRRRAWPYGIGVLVLLMAAAGWSVWVYSQIERFASRDQATPSDAIVVFGAAEYDGRPSPVYRARLDHALNLYRRKIAPLIVTLGGDGGDAYSEGAVGRAYLMAAGVPESATIAETHSRSTVESVGRLAAIARTNGFHQMVVVSDATHLFRIHAICSAFGLSVVTSPRPRVAVESNPSDLSPIFHEILSYAAWKLHLE